ncbi:MAG: helix-turn-helix domain-containing protein [Gammaproteobacteria bacterium]|nr:helix-turn-helix domain-containing protein [Gammaproteobacteria bacterium]MCW5582782.1 helix-turn-helix domain-containing protein [Gammaproteobacteria bacterium]
MINQPLEASIIMHKSIPFGIRLKSAREALGIDRKDIAAQLRLHEQVITMIENGEFKSDLPLTFVRGYIRNYSKLLEIPEQEVKEALELLKPKPDIDENASSAEHTLTPIPSMGRSKFSIPVNISNFFMQFFTYLIAITIIGLVGIWWHTHKTNLHPTSDNSIQQSIPIHADTLAAEPTTHRSENNSMVTNKNELMSSSDTSTTTVPPAANTIPNTTLPNSSGTISTSTDSLVRVPEKQSTLNKGHFGSLFNKGDKAALTQAVIGDWYVKSLASLIIFLGILVMSMHQYPSQPITTARTKTIRTLHKLHPSLHFSKILTLPNKFKLNGSMQLYTLISVFLLLGIGSLWWYKHTTTPSSIPSAKQPPAITKKENPSMDLPLDVNIEILIPSFNFDEALQTTFKIGPLQAMTNQLKNYIHQAAAIKSTLTNKSTSLGRPIYKKKSRKRHVPRPAYLNYENTQSTMPTGFQFQE